MTSKEALARLESLADQKVYAHNIKRGAGKNQFGVKMGDIRAVANKIRKDHALALELWKTGNIDARLLAILIMDPDKLSATELEKMVGSIDFVQEAEWMSSYVLKEYANKEKFREDWMKSKNKWIARAGWSLTAGRVARSSEGMDLEKLLDRIEKEMPKAIPEVQWTMNFALAYVGIHHPRLRKRAIDIGERLGVFRDYPVSKGCTSPFAPIWIKEIVSRQK